ncbi:MAG: amidohydrolase family protein [Armatimonadota bacterium]|nr:amidohydrolase family protein [Armatimonadota bacterium]
MADNAYTVVTSARLWDGTDRPPAQDAVVVVSGGRIVAAGARAAVTIPTGPAVRTLDYPDATVLPGLIDPHVHLMWPGDGRPADVYTKGADDAALLLAAARHARITLRAGVTTVRDVGSRGRVVMDLRDATAQGTAAGPRILAAGPPITITGGHMSYLGGEADTADDVRRAARRHWRMGADFFKLVTNGGGTPRTHGWIPAYTQAEIAAAVAEARAHETHLTVHANLTETIRASVAAGVNGIEHCTFLAGKNQPGFDQALAEEIARRGIHVGHTLTATYSSLRAARARWSELSPDERGQWDARQRVWDASVENFRRMRAMGVKFVAGTDAGWAHIAWGDYALAIELFTQTGASPLEALATGTRVAAEAIGLGDQIGTLEPGKIADLVVVAGDPTVRVSDLRAVKAVMRDGKVMVEDGRFVE